MALLPPIHKRIFQPESVLVKKSTFLIFLPMCSITILLLLSKSLFLTPSSIIFWVYEFASRFNNIHFDENLKIAEFKWLRLKLEDKEPYKGYFIRFQLQSTINHGISFSLEGLSCRKFPQEVSSKKLAEKLVFETFLSRTHLLKILEN